jgi:hypothetical protein
MAKLAQKKVFQFAKHWLDSYEQGFANSDCTFHALQMTDISLCVPEHREVARRAIKLIIDSGIAP